MIQSTICGFSEHTKQFLALLPLGFDTIVLIQQVSKEVFLVKLTHQPVLHNIFTVVDKQVHDSFGDLVGDGFADDVEVGRDEGADEFCFQSLSLGEFRITLGRLKLLVRFQISHHTNVLHWGGLGTYKLRIIIIIALT